jgi:hypothetical protein
MNGDIMRGGRDEAVASGATGLTGEPNIAGTTSGLIGAGAGTGIAEVSGAVAQWVEQVGRFLGVLQVALEQSRPSDDASAEVRALSGQLPALIRQCRAQVPTPEMIRTWVKTLTDDKVPQGVGPSDLPPRRTQGALQVD